MRCLRCDTENSEQAKFCLKCGARLADVCPHCQAPLPTQARFCTECGRQVAASPPSGAAAHDLLAQPLQRLVPQAYADRLLATRGQAVSERRLVTILFSDIKGSTAMAEILDPEDVMEIMNGALEVLIEPVARHEGTLARLMGDAVLAFFGAPLSHEDDAERAVLAALEIVDGARRYAVQLEAERGIRGFDVRVGINTGLVVVGEVGTELRVEYTAMGDAINLAARMEQHAPPGGILISHDTYRHVQGAFDVVPQQPLAVKGKAEPVQTYLVERARPRAFRRPTRGVEGVETPMVGRDTELARLQDALASVAGDRACQVVTVVGEAGVGKSRLLEEFDAWCEAQPARLTVFKGRVGQEMQNLPFALLRYLFSRAFEIRESDSAAVARGKLVNGWAAGFEEAEPQAEGQAEMKAHIVGQVLGLDFTTSPHVQAIGDDAQQLRDRALVYLGDYFRALAARRPVLMLLEDLHWADGSSLHAVDRLAASLWVGAETSPLLIVCAARPSLYQRRPGWGEGRPFHTRLDLDPLSRQDSRLLVGRILQRMEQVPESLRDLLVGGAEGNPFFLEELIKMLIEEGVIRKGETAWSGDAERLGALQVPPTLTGVLQARLDRLPFDQRQVLQQASVVGRLFWDLAVAHIATSARPDRAEAQTEAESEAIGAALAALGGREMIFPQATSSFEGAAEYLFKHALLREVTYEGVLKRVRRVYHGLVAGWLMEHAADRVGEYTGLIADHLSLAGRSEEAATYLRRAAEQAAARYANEEAAGYYSRALELMPLDSPERFDLLAARAAVYDLVARRDEQRADVEEMVDLAEKLGDEARRCDALLALAGYHKETQFVDAQEAAGKALRIARELGDPLRQGRALRRLGELHWYTGDHPRSREELEAAIELLLEAGASGEAASGLHMLSMALGELSEPGPAMGAARESAALSQQAGDRRQEATAVRRLAIAYMNQNRYAEALPFARRALALHREVGDRAAEASGLSVLGMIQAWLGEHEEGERGLWQALSIAQSIGLSVLIGYFAAQITLYHYTRREDSEGCLQFVNRLLEDAKAGEDDWLRAFLLLSRGNVFLNLGQYDRAYRTFVTASQTMEKLGDLESALRGRAWSGLAQAYLGDHEGSTETLRTVAEMAREIRNDTALATALVLWSLANLLEGRPETLRAGLERVQEGLDLIPAPSTWVTGYSSEIAAALHLAVGKIEEAMEYSSEGLRRMESDPAPWWPERKHFTHSRILRALGRDVEADEHLKRAYECVMRVAGNTQDPELKQSWLENVVVNREILADCAKRGMGRD